MVMTLMSNPKGSVATIIVAADGSGDTTDIQTGINLLPATGGVVYVKEGTYDIDATITIPNSNISIVGAGHSTIVQTSDDIDVISASSESNLVIENFYIYGAGAGNAANNGINFNEVTDSIIRGVWVENTGADGINIVNSSTYINIISCFCIGSLGSGIHVDESQQLIISDTVLYINTLHGIEMDGSSSNTISTCSIYRSTRHGIYVHDDSNSNIISDCKVLENDYLNAATYDGIIIDANSDANIIEGNFSNNNDRYEVNVNNANCSDNQIIGNNFNGTDRVGAINDVGTNTEVAHNKTEGTEGGGPPPSPSCFLAGTKISMDDLNYKNIEDVKVGDVVVSYDIKKKVRMRKKVTGVRYYKPEIMAAEFYIIINKKLKAVPNQLIFANGNWKKANELKLGYILHGLTNDEEIISIKRIYKKVPTYDLQVEDTFSYYAEGVLVHNMPACP